MIFRWDACGVVCVLLVYACLLYADYVVVYWLILPSFDQSIGSKIVNSFVCTCDALKVSSSKECPNGTVWDEGLSMLRDLWGVLHVCLFNVCAFLLLFSHTRAMTTDPGIVPRSATQIDFADRHAAAVPLNRQAPASDSDSDQSTGISNPYKLTSSRRNNTPVGDNWTVCGRCEAYRPPRAHHCRVCKRCIRKMDHHCPWINNCVGEYNQKYFLQFLLYVGVTSMYAVAMVTVAWAYPCIEAVCRTERHHHTKVLHTIFVSIEAVLFTLFVVAVSCDQISAIVNDETAVEQVQRRGPHRTHKTRRALMQEVCGPGPMFLWVFPCQNLPNARDIVHFPAKQHQYNV